MAEGKKLVIVESPTKMKSIQGYLGDGYEVLSSVGHIRDLADKKDIPADKKAAFGKYSIDVDNGFAPYYVESDRGKKTVAEAQSAMVASRFVGVRAIRPFSTSAFSAQAGLSPTSPGWMALTRIGASSTASVCTIAVTPPFTEVTVVEPG